MRDQHLGLRDLHRVLEVAAARREVERRVDAAGRVRAEPGAQHVGARRHPHRDVVAHLDAAVRPQAVRRPPGLARRLRARPRLVLEQQQRLVRSLRRAPREQLGKDALLAGREAELGGRRLSWKASDFLLTELKSLKLPLTQGSCQSPMGTSDRTPAQLLIPVPYPRHGEPLAAPGRAADARGHRARRATRRCGRSSSSSAEHGLAVEDIELLLLTHHHLDHTGLAGTDQGAVGRARRRARRDRRVGRRLPRAGRRRAALHGAAARGARRPAISSSPTPSRSGSTSSAGARTTRPTSCWPTATRSAPAARTLRVVHRPGHSTTDTLFVDDAANEAIVGDHLLAKITSGAETTQSDLPAGGRRRALFDYLDGSPADRGDESATAATPGTAPIIRDPARLIDERFAFHSARLDRIAEIVESGRRHGVRDLAVAVVGGGRGDPDRARDLGGARTPRHPRQPRHAQRGRRPARPSFLPSDGGDLRIAAANS